MFKFYLYLCIAIFSVILLCPLFSLTVSKEQSKATIETTAQAEVSTDTVKVMLSKDKSVVTLSNFDYILGSVAAEMPAYYEEEALKAQAVICYTYAVMMRSKSITNPDKNLNGAYLSDDSSIQQGYLSQEEMKEKWGSKYNEYHSKLEKAINAVSGQIITYNDEPITPAFHQISSGKTENAEVLWGKSIPYLVSVSSIGDRLSPNYSATTILSAEKFKAYAEKLNINLNGSPENWLGKIEKSEVGTVENITIGNTTVTGLQVQDAFGLNSAVFSIKYSDNRFTVTTLGKGHNIGLSQYGADYMARQGSDYKEILEHYYTGIKITTE